MIACLAALVLIVAAQFFLLTRLRDSETFLDEGVYLVSLVELQHGEALGRDVFASQMPGFYVLLEAIGAVTGVTVVGIRTGLAAITALGAVFAFLLGRRLGGTLAGVLMAGLIASAPVLPLIGGHIFADPTAMVLVLASLWLAAAQRPTAAGATFASAALVKLSVVSAAPTLVVLVLAIAPWRRSVLRAAGGALAVAAVVAIAYARDLGALWDGAVSYHVSGRHNLGVGGPDKLQAFFDYTTPYFWFVVAGAVATVWTWRRVWGLWLWPLLACVFVLRFQPLRDNQLVLLPYSFAVPTSVALGLVSRWRSPRVVIAAVALASVALAVGWNQQRNRVKIDLRPEDAGLVQAAAEVRRLTQPDDFVVSDQPIVAFMADRRIPGEFVDTSSLRFDTGSLTIPGVLRNIRDDPRIAVVVAGRAFYMRPELLEGLGRIFEHRVVGPSGVVFYGRDR
jgi:4-amino-4-deoxy-L-arabinose transferase-like glycosyltransferase